MSAADDQYCVLYEGTGIVENLKEYIIAVISAAVICGLITGICEKNGASGGLIRMLCGIFMAITVLSPLVRIRISDFELYLDTLAYDGAMAAEAGNLSAKEELSLRIIESTEAYILDKASSMGLSVEVEVTLSQENIPKPQAVYIKGTVPPYAKSLLKEWFKDNLGIGEENQRWQ